MEDASKNEILEAIGEFSNRVDEKFAAIDGKFAAIDGKFAAIDGKFAAIDSELKFIKSVMVTKDYLDDKLLDMKGDMVVMMRKEDEKVKTLVQILKQKNLLNDAEVKIILALEPFPNR
jgi:hypothetical protein